MKRMKYGFGGGGDKSPKKVTAVPQGYVEDTEFVDKDNPNRKYYKLITNTNISNNTLPVRKPTAKVTSSVPIVRPKPNNSTTQNIDRVYMEPEQVIVPPVQKQVVTPTIVDAPANSFRGDNIFMRMGTSNRAIGQAAYPTRNSNSQAIAGNVNTANQNVKFQYYKPNTATLDGNTIEIPSDEWNNRGNSSNFADTSFINKYKPKMANGGDIYSGIASSLSQLIPFLTENTSQQSRQPLVNVNSVRNMVNPYSNRMFAFGGDMSDVSEDDIQALQDEADSQGISISDLIEKMNNSSQDTDNDDEQEEVSDEDDGTDANSFKWGGMRMKKALGGEAGANPIEVEGNEVVHEPGKAPVKMVGPSHEQGGIDINVKDGTKIFSDRLKIDGKSMQERKISRVKKLDRLNKLLIKNPESSLLKNSILRTKQTTDLEEQKDMMLQNVANKVYAPPTQQSEEDNQSHAFGGRVYWSGGTKNDHIGDSTDGYLGLNEDNFDTFTPNYSVNNELVDDSYNAVHPIGSRMAVPSVGMGNGLSIKTPDAVESESSTGGMKMTLGDTIGMAGSLYGAIAPLANTIANAKATRPVINRYMGVGQRAIDANNTAQTIEGQVRNKALEDINTSSNTMFRRNRNSASSINTLRALDAGTNMSKERGIADANSNHAAAMVGLLDKRGQLTNFQDQYQDYGQTHADEANASNLDNFYTNRGANLAGISNTIQSLGKNLNTSQKNTDDEDLLAMLSQYGLRVGRGKKGRFQLTS